MLLHLLSPAVHLASKPSLSRAKSGRGAHGLPRGQPAKGSCGASPSRKCHQPGETLGNTLVGALAYWLGPRRSDWLTLTSIKMFDISKIYYHLIA